MVIYLENRKDSSRKLLELIKEFSKVSVALLYTNSNQAENQIKNLTPFTIAAPAQNKILSNIPNKGGERPLQGKLQSTAERNHRQHKKWKLIPCSRWVESNCENDHTAKNSLQIQRNSHQNTTIILHKTRKRNPKIHMKQKKSLHS